MQIDDNIVKGQGAQAKINNRFEQYDYVQEHMEGIDVFEEKENKTKVIQTFPKSIVNKVSSEDLHFDWSMNPYQGCEHGCAYCYARPTHEFWGYDAGPDFERVILVKRNAPELLRSFLNQRSWQPELIMMSGMTDPYQPIERKEGISRKLIEVMLGHRNPLGIITKNTLVLRDIDLLAEMASMKLVKVAISITTMNEVLRRRLEPRTSTGRRRFNAVEELSKAGVPVTVMIAPIIPALNFEEIPELLRLAAESGARNAHYIVARLNGSVAPVFENWVRKHYPERADKVLNQIKHTHGGELSDHRSGKRLRGEGEFARTTKELFAINKRKFFSDTAEEEYDFSLFRRRLKGQLDLFNE